jgi:hypothetical protein
MFGKPTRMDIHSYPLGFLFNNEGKCSTFFQGFIATQPKKQQKAAKITALL